MITAVGDAGIVQSLLQARYYNGGNGQFLSEDSTFWGTQQNLKDPQSLNSYSYANDNPLINSDPTGLWAASYNLASIGGEEGFGLFAGGNANLSMAFVSGKDGGFALTMSGGGTGGYLKNSVSYPTSPTAQASFINGAFAGAGCTWPCGGNVRQYGGSFSPTTNSLGDLNSPADTINFNYARGSFSRQEDADGNVTFSASFKGMSKGASFSRYPVDTKTLFSVSNSSIWNAGNRVYQSSVNAANGAYQSAVAQIQSRLNYLKAEVAKLTAVRTK